MYKKINQCRICGNPELVQVLDLGIQVLTGVFPKTCNDEVTAGPLRLVKCHGDQDTCGLLQLEHSYDTEQMYGDNYGYRSGLNTSMVEHLQQKVERVCSQVSLQKTDLILDIGSNDGTTLRAYAPHLYQLVGIDPTGTKFQHYYPSHIELIPDFFSASLVQEKFPGKKAKIITSFSMFYDLEDPLKFMQDIHSVLSDDGIWVFEQSYMPRMLETNSYDTVCHEHLEFYALKQIYWMAEQVGFTIIDVEFNDINGGSFSVTAAKKSTSNAIESMEVSRILKTESNGGLDGLEPFHKFATRVSKSRDSLLAFIHQAREEGKTIVALGASTKGNVLLQYCGLTSTEIPIVGEVNAEKFGRYTPGSCIPIVPENEVLSTQPDFILILPWHFKEFFETSGKFEGFNKLYPLPTLHVSET